MYEIIKPIHSFWSYLVILMLFSGIVSLTRSVITRRAINETAKKVSLFTMISLHIQLLLGVLMYISSPLVKEGFKDFGASMKDSNLRMFLVEHPVVMIISALLITWVYKNVKFAFSQRKQVNPKAILLYLFAMVLILSRVPWNIWLGV